MRTAPIVALCAAALSTSTFADSVELTLQGVGAGRVVRVHSDDTGTLDVFAGQLHHAGRNADDSLADFNGGFIGFCVELAQYVAPTWSTFERIDVEDGPNSAPMETARADAVRDLFGVADGRQYDDDAYDFAAAFQLALWEVVNDYDGSAGSLDVDDGAFRAHGAWGSELPNGVRSHLDELFLGIGGDRSHAGVFVLSNGGFQDQVVAVPVPAPVALGLAGLAAVMARRLHKRRRAA